MKKKTYNIIGYSILGVGTLSGCYIYFWLMFLKPILLAVKAFDAGTLTGMMILKTLACCFLGEIPACVIMLISVLIASIVMNYGSEHGK